MSVAVCVPSFENIKVVPRALGRSAIAHFEGSREEGGYILRLRGGGLNKVATIMIIAATSDRCFIVFPPSLLSGRCNPTVRCCDLFFDHSVCQSRFSMTARGSGLSCKAAIISGCSNSICRKVVWKSLQKR